MLRRLALQFSHYTLGNLLITLASIVSFPIFTRTFSVEDYGALNLIASLILFWVGVGKLGIQNAITRFHAEVYVGRGKVDESGFLATVLLGMAATGAVATLGWIVMDFVVPADWWGHQGMADLLLPLSGFVLLRVVDSAVNNTLRAQQRSILFNVYGVVRRYLWLAVVLVTIFHFLPGLPGFYLGSFLAEGVTLIAMIVYLVIHHRVRLSGFSYPAYREMLVFGLPMVAHEMALTVLLFGDRYVMQALLGGEALGQYSAAYNFCQYAQGILLSSVSQAVVPMYSRLWEEKGEEATRLFVERALKFYFMLACAVVAGMSAVGGEFLTTLASDKYAPGTIVIPLVIASMVLDSGAVLFGAGMYVMKAVRKIIPWLMLAALINVGLNLLLMPRIGIIAAGVSVMAAYILLAFAAWKIGSAKVRIRVPFGALAKYAVLALVMYVIVTHVSAPGRALDMAVKVATGVVVYTALLAAFDAEARGALTWLRARYAARLGKQGT